MDNIEKSGFHRGEYVGYSDGAWRIRKSNSSYGNWHAQKQDDPNQFIYAFTLAEMSKKLHNLHYELMKVGDKNREANRKENPGRRKHSAKWDHTVAAIKKKGGTADPYAVATAQMGKRSYLRNPPHGSAKDYDKAYALYKEFREEVPKRGRKVEFSMPKVLMIMGNVRSISYDTTRNKKTELYKHDFAVGSRPLLCADGRTGQLFVIEGRYHVTPRGIVDTDARGRELE